MLKKNDKMLFELKASQASTLGKNCTIQRKDDTFDFKNTECSHYSTNSDIKILQENFGKIYLEPKIQFFFDKTKPVNLTRN
jgi:hypothetical protein